MLLDPLFKMLMLFYLLCCLGFVAATEVTLLNRNYKFDSDGNLIDAHGKLTQIAVKYGKSNQYPQMGSCTFLMASSRY